MNITIYDFANNKKVIETDKDIVAVHVDIRSGDEIATLYDSNGHIETYDAYDGRRKVGYEDGSYDISDSDKVKAWAQWEPESLPPYGAISYYRYDYFCEDGEYDRLHEQNLTE